MTDSIELRCQEIERCNQRGGRMLSAVDLLLANTVTPDLAAVYGRQPAGGAAAVRAGAAPVDRRSVGGRSLD